jgi:pilus assembly protein CpaB
LKRSNRLILLIGVLLAIVAFVGIVLISSRPSTTENGGPEAPVELDTVIAVEDIPLGVEVEADMVTTQKLATTARLGGAYESTSAVVGQIVRSPITAGAQVTSANFATTGTMNPNLSASIPAGKVAITVQVDQVSGVGTVIRTGDFVDLLIGLTGDKFPVITPNPEDPTQFVVVGGLNNTSVKLLLQGMQVIGTLLPPVQTAEGQAPVDPGSGPTALTGQQEIVALAVSPQQAEVIKFAQLDGSISLVLRSPTEFADRDPEGNVIDPPPTVTSGIILKTLVDEYNVIVPQLVETILPEQEQ